MRLKKIKLAGFKSFVDPTVVELKSNLEAILGPNGCGKSNIIEATSWAMGESSAKNLRGESMEDVIFNGSTTRKPVGQASVELVFDNQDGRLGGEYASYAEISVKRQINRNGDNFYFLNNTRCRRKDISDIFLGTGLGPRSYSIIRQGMISRVIEARPEDLRGFLEEAAGISVYKKRRHETEIRMRHTKENLDRLLDLSQEQDKQLGKLEKQSESAQKFQGLNDALLWKDAALTYYRFNQLSLEKQSSQAFISENSLLMEAKLADKASLELQIEQARLARTEKQDSFQKAQAAYYHLSTEIARLEQGIEHEKKRRLSLEQTLRDLDQEALLLAQQRAQDLELEAEYQEKVLFLEPEYIESQAYFANLQERFENAQQGEQGISQRWENLQTAWNDAHKKTELESLKIEQFDKQAREAQQRIERIQAELKTAEAQASSEELEFIKGELAAQELILEEAEASLALEEEKLDAAHAALKAAQGNLRTAELEAKKWEARLQSLLELDAPVIEKSAQISENWHYARLKDQIKISEARLEPLFEKILEQWLDAYCIAGFSEIAEKLGDQTKINGQGQDLKFLESQKSDQALTQASGVNIQSNITDLPRLIDYVTQGQAYVQSWNGIYLAKDLAQALDHQVGLLDHESIVTEDGICLGRSWLHVMGAGQEQGALVRKRLQNESEAALHLAQEALDLAHTECQCFSEKLQHLQAKMKEQVLNQKQIEKEIQGLEQAKNLEFSKLDQVSKQKNRLEIQISEEKQRMQLLQEEVGVARERLQTHINVMDDLSQEKIQVQAERENTKQAFLEAHKALKEAQEKAHALAMEHKTVETQLQGIKQSLLRSAQQVQQLEIKQGQIKSELNHPEQEDEILRFKLEELLAQHHLKEQEFSLARTELEDLENRLKNFEKERDVFDRELGRMRDKLEQAKLEQEALHVKLEGLEERLRILDLNQEALLEIKNLDWESFKAQEVQRDIEALKNEIANLGPINMAAIEEYKAEAERKIYLDSQLKDLNLALDTLIEAIEKIDQETKARFTETFTHVNQSFQTLFPKLFGGGQAYLEMEGDDILTAGVSMMARPPGKKNSSIHLLSGGEKALTAVALVFAIFQLNPAPFCMLDEVDAPLDDANVGRFCLLVKELSNSVQFIYITHNKLTMEMANHLSGVTMKEPGVSRLVSVDMEEAQEMIQA
ncbi:MAG: chromosome segregation protein SMC [Gammaproteobacteria bacterium]